MPHRKFRREPPCETRFTDNVLLCDETREGPEKIKVWGTALSDLGVKVCWKKTVYLCTGE